ncbi:MAG TPA: universal stress protein [Fimbriimonas sp.]|nr:universal stress protein [Fimbriimonas sp.]
MVLPIAEVSANLRQSGEQALEDAKNLLSDERITEVIGQSMPIPYLTRIAEDKHAPLIAVGSGQYDESLPWKLGSVARALSYSSQQSLLIAKEPAISTGPLYAIFATDHSDYAKAALRKLIEWAPQGLMRIDVLTVYDFNDATLNRLQRESHFDFDAENLVREKAMEETRAAAAELKAICPDTNALVRKGPVNECIRDEMASTGAELLIMGAQGHGFYERLFIGSVSLYQTLATPHSVLLIRR